MLTLYRRLIALRNDEPALTAGANLPWRSQGNVLLFGRRLDDRRLLVAANIGGTPNRIESGTAVLVLATDPAQRQGLEATAWELSGDQGIVLALSSSAPSRGHDRQPG